MVSHFVGNSIDVEWFVSVDRLVDSHAGIYSKKMIVNPSFVVLTKIFINQQLKSAAIFINYP